MFSLIFAFIFQPHSFCMSYLPIWIKLLVGCHPVWPLIVSIYLAIGAFVPSRVLQTTPLFRNISAACRVIHSASLHRHMETSASILTCLHLCAWTVFSSSAAAMPRINAQHPGQSSFTLFYIIWEFYIQIKLRPVLPAASFPSTLNIVTHFPSRLYRSLSFFWESFVACW